MNPKQDITDLTVCRAFFAAWVFVYHVDLYLHFSAWLGPFAGLIRRGYLGVDGFFILSGLILARVHPEISAKVQWQGLNIQARPLSLTSTLKFWGKRLARIYPVHFATLALFAIIFLIGTAHGLTPRDPQRFSLPAFIQNLTLVQGWGFSTQGAWDYPSWSVSTEWAGYLLFPLLWYAVSYFDVLVSAQIIIAAMTLLGLIAVRYHGSLNLNFADGLFRFFPEFIIGIATARLVPSFADAAPRRTLAILGAGLVLFCGLVNFDLISVVGLWLLLFALTMQADAEFPAMLGRRVFLHRLGLLSYAFYMSFALAELLVSQFFRRQGWAPASHALLFAGAMLAITSVLAVLLNRLIERPCRRAADRWLAAPAPASLSLAAKPH